MNLDSILSFQITGLNSQGCSLVYPAAFDGIGVKSMKPFAYFLILLNFAKFEEDWTSSVLDILQGSPL